MLEHLQGHIKTGGESSTNDLHTLMILAKERLRRYPEYAQRLRG